MAQPWVSDCAIINPMEEGWYEEKVEIKGYVLKITSLSSKNCDLAIVFYGIPHTHTDNENVAY